MRICLIGAGNVATHLARRLGRAVAQVYAPTLDHARRVAQLAAGEQCLATDRLPELIPDADVYLIAVKDDAVARVAADTPDFPGVWAHTSGSVAMETLREAGKSRCGVVYPLQTFSREAEVDFSCVPVFVEGSDEETTGTLEELARRLTRAENVRRADSALRRRLHLAAVFACNFANLMWLEADDLLRGDGLTVGSLLPLIRATVDKLEAMNPREAMTGPARRGDKAVIAKHLAMLTPEKRDLYGTLSEEIARQCGAKT